MVDIAPNELGVKSSENPSAKTPSVLLIDDHTVLLEGMKRALGEIGGIKAKSTANPFDGLRMVEKAKTDGHPVDVVICDLNMRGMNGRELAREMKGLVGCFILQSTDIEESKTMTPEESEATGIDMEIPKDGEITELLKYIKAAKNK